MLSIYHAGIALEKFLALVHDWTSGLRDLDTDIHSLRFQ
jgi:hypothetical protein